MDRFKRGFTLIELLVVVAIIGILASITLGYLSSARLKGADAAVKSNLDTVRPLSENFYLDNNSSYLPAGGSTFAIATCPVYNAAGTNMLSQNKNIADAIAAAVASGGSSSCYNSGNGWAVAVGLKLTANTSWCVDNSGVAKLENFVVGSAIDPALFTCK